MQKRKSIILSKIYPFGVKDLAEIYKKLSLFYYSEERGFGFTDVEINNHFLVAKLLKKTPTYIHELNLSTNEIEKKCIFLMAEIEFAFDATFNLLEIISSQKDAQKVRVALRNVLDNKYSIETLTFFAYKIIPLFNNTSNIRINKLKINNFQYNNKVTGVFLADTSNNKEAVELIDMYKTDIKKVSFTININNISEVEITLTDLGGLTIKSENNNFEEILYYIKSIILKK